MLAYRVGGEVEDGVALHVNLDKSLELNGETSTA
jgi:hypothetical protein